MTVLGQVVMAPSKKKDLVCCANCDCYLAPKDLDRHKKLCQELDPFTLECILDSNTFHGFLSSGILYAAVEPVPKAAPVLELTGSQKTQIAYMHPVAMKQLGLSFRSHCLVCSEEDQKVVSVLPCDQIGLTSISFRMPFARQKNTLVACQPVRKLEVCSSVTLKPASPSNAQKTFINSEEFSEYLKTYLADSVHCSESILEVPYFAQRVLMKIDSWKSSKSETLSLVENLQNLSLDNGLETSTRDDSSVYSTPRRQAANSSSTSINSLSSTPLGKNNQSIAVIIPVVSDLNQLTILRFQENTEFEVSKQSTTQSAASDNLQSSSLVNFSAVGGMRTAKQQLTDFVITPSADNNSDKGIMGISTILVSGSSGCGKSLLLNALAGELKCFYTILSAASLATEFFSNGLQSLNSILSNVMISGDCTVVIIEDLDVLCSSKEGGNMTEAAQKLTNAFCQAIDNMRSGVFLVCSVTSAESIHASLRRRFHVEVDIPVPSSFDRREILRILVEIMQMGVNVEDIATIADSAHGFTGSDLQSACKLAISLSSPRSITAADLRDAVKRTRPSALREITLEVAKVLWSDVGGQEDLKICLQQAVEWPLKHADSFKRLGITPPAGVLLYGPPGCSKTLVARAVATESGLNFLAVKGPELFSKWVGESERAVRELFKKARQAAPAVIFFDEIDAVATARGGSSGGGSGVGDRVLAQLLTEMDGLESLGHVSVIAATNRPDVLDRALLRPGRLDRVIHVPLPDSTTRAAILKLQLGKMPIRIDDVDWLVRKTEGFSGAEVVAVCKEAALAAMRSDINVQVVTEEFFEVALKTVKPRTDKSLLQLYEDFASSCGSNASSGSSSGDAV